MKLMSLNDITSTLKKKKRKILRKEMESNVGKKLKTLKIKKITDGVLNEFVLQNSTTNKKKTHSKEMPGMYCY